ncbi:GNAT family N-acetyltransferase [Candidatus Saccharibacteria bacterium]|nr:GNAT family N-acetyltransferase [Candidatus Saccharibacteria bacterium]
MSDIEIRIERLKKLSDSDVDDINRILPNLTEDYDGRSVNMPALTKIISSPLHEQFVARDQTGRIVGMATLSEVISIYHGSVAYLEDIFVDANAGKRGIGSMIWDAMLDWCHERGIKRMEFTCRPEREAATNFYKKHGCEIRNTNCFRLKL